MTTLDISLAELRADLARYLKAAERAPIRITREGDSAFVLMDAQAYDHLVGARGRESAPGEPTRADTRQALYPHELDEEMREALADGYKGGPTPDIDHLMD